MPLNDTPLKNFKEIDGMYKTKHKKTKPKYKKEFLLRYLGKKKKKQI